MLFMLLRDPEMIDGTNEEIKAGVLSLWTWVLTPGVWGPKKAETNGFCWAVYIVTSGKSIWKRSKVYSKFFLNEGYSS